MLLHQSSRLSMIVWAIEFFIISSTTFGFEDEPDCTSFTTVCNDFQTARRCQSLPWCENQGAACDAAYDLKVGSTILFGDTLNTIHSICHNNFMAFRRSGRHKDEQKTVKIKFEVEEGHLPFSVRFHFRGNNVSLLKQDEAKMSIKLNNKIIYDSFYNGPTSK